mmetsp:Transcript_44822/g.138268  ORF Transcript_44822/g.138268 Transcript_44822/m.138268 type:complete len:599 (+) Transcript_44822:163-1959(+)
MQVAPHSRPRVVARTSRLARLRHAAHRRLLRPRGAARVPEHRDRAARALRPPPPRRCRHVPPPAHVAHQLHHRPRHLREAPRVPASRQRPGPEGRHEAVAQPVVQVDGVRGLDPAREQRRLREAAHDGAAARLRHGVGERLRRQAEQGIGAHLRPHAGAFMTVVAVPPVRAGLPVRVDDALGVLLAALILAEQVADAAGDVRVGDRRCALHRRRHHQEEEVLSGRRRHDDGAVAEKRFVLHNGVERVRRQVVAVHDGTEGQALLIQVHELAEVTLEVELDLRLVPHQFLERRRAQGLGECLLVVGVVQTQLGGEAAEGRLGVGAAERELRHAREQDDVAEEVAAARHRGERRAQHRPRRLPHDGHAPHVAVEVVNVAPHPPQRRLAVGEPAVGVAPRPRVVEACEPEDPLAVLDGHDDAAGARGELLAAVQRHVRRHGDEGAAVDEDQHGALLVDVRAGCSGRMRLVDGELQRPRLVAPAARGPTSDLRRQQADNAEGHGLLGQRHDDAAGDWGPCRGVRVYKVLRPPRRREPRPGVPGLEGSVVAVRVQRRVAEALGGGVRDGVEAGQFPRHDNTVDAARAGRAAAVERRILDALRP